MNTRDQKATQKGFTLIELLIVVVILGILAAVVIPQLSGATDGAKTESLKTNLTRVRTAIDLYNSEHSKYPGVAIATGATCPNSGTAAASGAAGTKEAFAAQLTMYTNAAGLACSTTDTTFKYGPYIKAAVTGVAGIPVNPISNSNAVNVVSAGDLNMTGAATPAGWKYDETIGKFIADDTANDHL